MKLPSQLTCITALCAGAFCSSSALATTTHQHSVANYDYNVEQEHQLSQARSTKHGLSANTLPTHAGQQSARTNPPSTPPSPALGQSSALSLNHHNDYFDVTTFQWANNSTPTMAFSGVLSREAQIKSVASAYVHSQGLVHGASPRVLGTSPVEVEHDLGRGAIVARYQQRHNGLEVVGRRINVVMDQGLNVVASTGFFSPAASAATQATGFALKPQDAVQSAFADLTGHNIKLILAGEKAGFTLFDAKTASNRFHFTDQPRAKQVYYPTPKRLIPAYYTELMLTDSQSATQLAFAHIYSASDGTLLSRQNLTNQHAYSYRVFAQSTPPYTPYDSPVGNDLSPHPTGVYSDIINEVQAPMNVITLEHAGISTGDPWLVAGSTETRGNNVDAYADLVAPDGFTADGDIRAQVTQPGLFNYPYSFSMPVDTPDNINAAIVNLFYVNNFLHDLFYDHGFDEPAGVAQMDNFGRGGIDGDPLHVEAQDSSGINNANMATPSDGFPPRMQMYLWEADGEGYLEVGKLQDIPFRGTSNFGSQNFDISGDVILVDDGDDANDGHVNDGCQPPINGLSGTIALIFRGSCSFVEKVRHAQQANAIGAIIFNNDTTNPDSLMTMGGSDGWDITIPAIFVSYNSGQDIIEQLDNEQRMTHLSQELRFRDGTVDNAIIEHEWGHYITRRLAHGLYDNSQGRSMGEGWGDFIALLNMVREEDQFLAGNNLWQGVYNDGGYSIAGGYVDHAYYFGLRRAPYSTDMNVNGLTFKHIEDQVPLPTHHPISGGSFAESGGYNSEVHAAGEIWAIAMWESYAALLNRPALSFNEAKRRMLDYIVAGLKITPPSPTFTEARDAMLAVALANDIQDYYAFRQAFTKRGMGVAAVSPDRNDPGFDGTATSEGHQGVVEDFDSSAAIVQQGDLILNLNHVSPIGAYCDEDGIIDVGETAELIVHVHNQGVTYLSGIQANVSSTSDISFSNQGIINFPDMPQWNDSASGRIEVTLNSAQVNETIPVSIGFSSSEPGVSLPEPIEIEVVVNRDIVKDPAKTLEDFENPTTVNADWIQTKIGQEHSGYFAGINDWSVIEDIGFGTGNFMLGPDGISETDLSLMTPIIDVGASGLFAMHFLHYFEFEASTEDEQLIAWDGGVLEISVDGGEWIDVVDAGGVFAGGYNGIINPGDDELGFSPNPFLGGRPGFVGWIGSDSFIDESITFDDGILNGHSVQFRFRIGTDASVGAFGWMLDNIHFTNATNPTYSIVAADSGICVNRPPALDITPQQVPEATGDDVAGPTPSIVTLAVSATDFDNPNQAFTYQWQQLSGPMVSPSNAQSAAPQFTAPPIGQDTELLFEVSVSDGAATSRAIASVMLINVNSPPTLHGIQGPYNAEEGSAVTLNVNATDPENDPLFYFWEINDRSYVETDNQFLIAAPEVTGFDTLIYTLRVSDGEYISPPQQFTLSVVDRVSPPAQPTNRAPSITRIDGPTSAHPDEQITITATASDPDGDTLRYEWMQIEGPEVSLSSSAMLNFIAPTAEQQQVLGFQLVVKDGQLASAPMTYELTIQPAAVNNAPTISAVSAPSTVSEQQQVSVSIQGQDSDGDNLIYSWTQVDGPVVESQANTNGFVFTAPEVDSPQMLAFDVVANDGSLDSNIESVVIEIIPSPTLVLSANDTPSQANNLSLSSSEQLTLSVSSCTGQAPPDTFFREFS